MRRLDCGHSQLLVPPCGQHHLQICMHPSRTSVGMRCFCTLLQDLRFRPETRPDSHAGTAVAVSTGKTWRTATPLGISLQPPALQPPAVHSCLFRHLHVQGTGGTFANMLLTIRDFESVGFFPWAYHRPNPADRIRHFHSTGEPSPLTRSEMSECGRRDLPEADPRTSAEVGAKRTGRRASPRSLGKTRTGVASAHARGT